MSSHRKPKQLRKPNNAELAGIFIIIVFTILVLTGTIHPSS